MVDASTILRSGCARLSTLKLRAQWTNHSTILVIWTFRPDCTSQVNMEWVRLGYTRLTSFTQRFTILQWGKPNNAHNYLVNLGLLEWLIPQFQAKFISFNSTATAAAEPTSEDTITAPKRTWLNHLCHHRIG